MPNLRWAWLLLGCLLIGCNRELPGTSVPSGAPLPEIKIHLLVVDDAEMAAAIGQLRGDWQARTGAVLVISESTSENLLAADKPTDPLDAIIYPSALLGTLAERKWIAPLPADFAGNRELAWADTFELLQMAETRWGQTSWAVSLGAPVLTCAYRPDLLEQFHKRPPQSWAEYHELAAFFNRRENLGDRAPAADMLWSGTIEPLAPGCGGRVLLARAAAYAKHRDHYSTLFHIDTMEPLIAGAPWVRALEELVADARFGPPNASQLDLAAARREFLAGHSALALFYPSHAPAAADQAIGEPVATAFVELPGSPKVYNFAAERWDQRGDEESHRVPLLGLAGRLGSIAEQAAHPDNAFQLLAWLSGPQWGTQVSTASRATTVYRRSQLHSPQSWVDPATNVEAAQQYVRSVNTALNRQQWLDAVRLPGHARYLASLDQAVAQAVDGSESPADALTQAAAEWRTITVELGLDAQRKAYRKSLGLDP
jgi:multiple sugar transport system substrate-binding protein